ncbi:MAG: hypothetical protein ABFD16_29455, partial [Thermoguttaceae bacterium]
LGTHIELLVTIGFTTVCWLLTAYLGPQTDRQTLIEFYQKIRPFGPGWAPIRQELALSGKDQELEATGENIPLALLGWVSGCTAIWSSLFAVGNYLYGRMDYAYGLTAVFVVSGLVLIRVINRLWR